MPRWNEDQSIFRVKITDDGQRFKITVPRPIIENYSKGSFSIDEDDMTLRVWKDFSHDEISHEVLDAILANQENEVIDYPAMMDKELFDKVWYVCSYQDEQARIVHVYYDEIRELPISQFPDRLQAWDKALWDITLGYEDPYDIADDE